MMTPSHRPSLIDRHPTRPNGPCWSTLLFGTVGKSLGKALPLSVATAILLVATGSPIAVAAVDSTLIESAYAGDLKKVQAQVNTKADVNQVDENGYTALHWAAYNGSMAIAEYLLAHGADPNKQDKSGCTPLMIAAGQKKLNVAEALLKRGARVDVVSTDGFDALAYAGGDVKMMALLVTPASVPSPEPAGPPSPAVQPTLRDSGAAPIPSSSAPDLMLTGTEVERKARLTAEQAELAALPPVERRHELLAVLLSAAIPGAGYTYATGDSDRGRKILGGTAAIDGIVVGVTFLVRAILTNKVPSVDSMLVPAAIGIGATHVVLAVPMVEVVRQEFKRQVDERVRRKVTVADGIDAIGKASASRQERMAKVQALREEGDNARALACINGLDDVWAQVESVSQLREQITARVASDLAAQQAKEAAERAKDALEQARVAAVEAAQRAAVAKAQAAVEKARAAAENARAAVEKAKVTRKLQAFEAAIRSGSRAACLRLVSTHAKTSVVLFGISDAWEIARKKDGEIFLVEARVESVHPEGLMLKYPDSPSLFVRGEVNLGERVFVRNTPSLGVVDGDRVTLGVVKSGTVSYDTVGGARATVHAVTFKVNLTEQSFFLNPGVWLK